ncbi:nicotinate-nucleotide--dimethylbenzimidazole phosphoribosyltransferase [Streptomyces sp. NBC_01335]|uniref:nicotinate-nucleotide--dimethylbenzimidazole phosphoribosyltransferase n=1 Tax=Streptomyces sp. NBC_01335 TaxID=2903828 RepID=UPI002E14C94D|nr:nicotinate-nucleotide--dimethylbenzimidazole phosphoribosyltransferase [Streptomyces sp. NBC_01335]
MTDTGQVPGEGQPENAGMVEQPGVLAPDAYTYLDPSEQAPDEEEMLLMPAAQGGGWGDPQIVPPPAADAYQQFPAQSAYPAQEPPSQGPASHDSGAFDLGGVRIPAPTPAPAHTSAATPSRRPLHRGPSVDGPSYGGQSGLVRSLADRGPAGSPQPQAPVRTAAPAPVAPDYQAPAGSPVPAEAPAHTEFPVPAEAPVHTEAFAAQEPVLPGPQLGEIPLQGAAPWGAPETVAAAEEQPAAAVTPADEPAPAETAPVEAVPVEAVITEAATAEPAPVDAAPAEYVPAEALQQPAPEYVPAPEAAPGFEPVAAAQDHAPEHAPAEAPAGFAAEDPAETVVPEAAAEPAAHAPVFVPEAASEAYVPEADAAPAAEFTGAQLPEQVRAPVEVPAPVAQAPAEDPVAEPITAEPSAAGILVTEEPAAGMPAEEAAAEAPAAEPAPLAEPVALDAAPAALPEAGTGAGNAPEFAVPQAAGAPWAVEPPAAGQGAGPQYTEPEHQSVRQEQPHPAEAPVFEAPVFEAVAAEPLGSAAPAEAVAAQPAAEEPEAEYAAPEEPATDPAPGYDEAEREAVLRVMRERRDIRNGFRSDPIPHEVLLRVLEAAHTAPSVGHSQPWDFVVIRSAETRRSMHELAQRQRDAYAKSLPKGRAKQFREMKIEAILDTPVNIVVTADPTRGGRHTLGRHTQPQMAPYSSALAVENLWLAARAEGLGVGWVSFFDEREMVRALGLPEHLEVVAYLCVGYVDEFPEEPELMQAGWSKRRPLSWVVHEETYGRRALPGEEPHDLLQETIANIRPLDAKALGEAWERQKRMTTPAGALGMLEIISAQLAGLSRTCPPPIPEPAAVAIFAGDHGVHAQGVTSWPQEVTGQMVANFLAGGAVCNAFASQVGAEVCVVDVGVATELPATPGLLPRKVRPGTADFTTGPAMSREDVLAAIEVGIETARDLVAAGNKGLLIGEMGIANTTASAALICVYTGADPSEVTGRGTGINDEMHARKVDVVRRALELHQPDPSDPIGVLAAVGGLEHAAMAGYLLGGASLRTPVILDGVSAGAAALVARAIAPEALAACIAGHRSAEPGHVAALNKLGLRPLIDLDLRLGEGTGALLALPIVQSAARAMHEVATFDSAGVTEK